MQRRDFLKKIGIVTALVAVTPTMSFAAKAKGPASPNAYSYKQALHDITGGEIPQRSLKVNLKVPEIAENGAVVPVTVTVDSPMTEKEYVKTIRIYATKNKNSRCLVAHLTPANAKAMISTRIKLGGTQDVAVIVEMSDGTFLSAAKNVKVTIGGCG